MIDIHIIDEFEISSTINTEVVENCCKAILTDRNRKNGRINIIFTDDEELRKLKKEYFNMDVYTDVISFNLEDEGSDIEGEVYISLDRAKDNSQEFGEEFGQELKRLVIHGVLHLTGEEDEAVETKKNMVELENYYLNKISDNILK